MSGKGSGRRPQQVPEDEAAANWARIFNTPLRIQAAKDRQAEAVRREVLAAKAAGMSLEAALNDLDILRADRALATELWAQSG